MQPPQRPDRADQSVRDGGDKWLKRSSFSMHAMNAGDLPLVQVEVLVYRAHGLVSFHATFVLIVGIFLIASDSSRSTHSKYHMHSAFAHRPQPLAEHLPSRTATVGGNRLRSVEDIVEAAGTVQQSMAAISLAGTRRVRQGSYPSRSNSPGRVGHRFRSRLAYPYWRRIPASNSKLIQGNLSNIRMRGALHISFTLRGDGKLIRVISARSHAPQGTITAMNKKLKSIPKFRSEVEERRF